MRKFNPSNLDGDLMLEKSCDAMKSSNNMNKIANAINIINKRISLRWLNQELGLGFDINCKSPRGAVNR